MSNIELTGDIAQQAGWKTPEGVTIGMSLKQLRSIYPDAKCGVC